MIIPPKGSGTYKNGLTFKLREGLKKVGDRVELKDEAERSGVTNISYRLNINVVTRKDDKGKIWCYRTA